MPINTLINKADISKISEGLVRAKQNNFINNELLPLTNPLVTSNNPGGIIKPKSTITSLTSDQLKEYIAVATFVHCMDGWAYLSSATKVLFDGEPPISIHLAYYSELRGAISFLCSEGILISNSSQSCIESNDDLYIPGVNGAQKIKDSGTHKATWNILKDWVNNLTKDTNVLEYFEYRGKTFKELIQYIPGAGKAEAIKLSIIKKWLLSWCFDIDNYENDREGRNNTSYNPTINRKFEPIVLKDRLVTLFDFWSFLEPGASPFSKLDQQLLILYLNEVYTASIVNEEENPTENGSTPVSDTSSQREEFIDQFLENAGIEDPVLKNLFINNPPNTLLTQAADKQLDPATNEIKPLTIIARSILLLRCCSGACSFLFRQNNIKREDLEFYLNKIGDDLGIWDQTAPENLSDLWADISDLIDDSKEYFKDNNPPNIFTLRSSHPNYSDIYTQFYRVGLWGFGL